MFYLKYHISTDKESFMYISDYEEHLRRAVATGCAELEIAGRTRENDPVYALTVTDFDIPDDEKFHILIAGLHVGGERSALLAAAATLDWLLRKSSRRYLRKFAVTLMPAVNPYGCFRTDIDQYHNNSSGFDPYVGQWGKSFNYPELTLTDPEHEPELAAFCRVIDTIHPEILLDWHGANGKPGETMRETLGASLSNHFIMPWGTRLLSAMRKEICKGSSAVFDLEEYLERIPAPPEFRAMFPNWVRPSNAIFYPDLYAYMKYHTMPVVMEIGVPETGWRAVKGLMDYAMKLPPEYRGSLPVDHVGTDFGNLVAASYGSTPGMRRRSRVELRSKANGFMPFHASSMHLGELCTGLALGDSGLRRMIGDMPLHEVSRHHISEFPSGDFPGQEALRRALKNYRFTTLHPLLANTDFQCDGLGDVEPFQNGVTLQLFIPVGHRRTLKMTEVLLNGVPLPESGADGYELVRGSDGWHLFLNLPPERTRRADLFFVLAKYDMAKS